MNQQTDSKHSRRMQTRAITVLTPLACLLLAACGKQKPALTAEQIREQLVGSWHESGTPEEIVAFDANGQVTAWGAVVREPGRISYMRIREIQVVGINTLVVRNSSEFLGPRPDGLGVVTDARSRERRISYVIDTSVRPPMIRTFEHSTNTPSQETPFRAYAFTKSLDGDVSLDSGQFKRVSGDPGFFYDENKLRKEFE